MLNTTETVQADFVEQWLEEIKENLQVILQHKSTRYNFDFDAGRSLPSFAATLDARSKHRPASVVPQRPMDAVVPPPRLSYNFPHTQPRILQSFNA